MKCSFQGKYQTIAYEILRSPSECTHVAAHTNIEAYPARWSSLILTSYAGADGKRRPLPPWIGPVPPPPLSSNCEWMDGLEMGSVILDVDLGMLELDAP